MNKQRGIVFLVHHLGVLDHFRPVLEKLDSDTFVVLVEDRPESLYGNQFSLLEASDHTRWNVIRLSDAIRSRMCWKIGVSNHGYLIGLMADICQISVRFMYGVTDLNGWNFGPLNTEFDVALTHGPYDSHRLRREYGLETLTMGYPKYSEAHKQREEIRNAICEHLVMNSDEKLVIWVPTLDNESSITTFAKEFSRLRSRYRAYVKVHPMTHTQFPEQIDELISQGCSIWQHDRFSTTDLIVAADLTLHDLGGTGLASVFSCANPMFLAAPSKTGIQIGLNSPELIARNLLGVVEPGTLKRAVDNFFGSEEQRELRRRAVLALRSQFFSDFGGADAQVAADILKKLAKRRYWSHLIRSNRVVRSWRCALAGTFDPTII